VPPSYKIITKISLAAELMGTSVSIQIAQEYCRNVRILDFIIVREPSVREVAPVPPWKYQLGNA